jgi:micrococcal nuclease
MWPKRRRLPLRACAALALVTVFLGWRVGCANRRPTVADWSSSPLAEGEYEVARVVSGDSIEVRRAGAARGRISSIRLLGIELADARFDAPAKDLLQDRLAGGYCRLEFDKRRLDRKGGFLAYLYVGEVLLNEELVREGFARLDLKPDDSAPTARRLSNAQTDAQESRRGVWADR